MAASLNDVKAMVDELDPKDVARLVEYVAPRLVNAVQNASADRTEADRAWREYRRVGEQLAALPGESSLTEAVSRMRG